MSKLTNGILNIRGCNYISLPELFPEGQINFRDDDNSIIAIDVKTVLRLSGIIEHVAKEKVLT